MQSNSHRLARRDVLRAAGGAAAAVGVTGLSSAKPGDRVRVNVGFAAGSGRQAAVEKAEEVVREFNSLNVVTLELPKRAAEAIAARKDVRYVEKDGEMHALAQTLPWGVDRVDADLAHANGYSGSGADIAIIDTGIDSDHPDLQANIGAGADFTGTGSWDDDNGHGTHCAGIANAADNTEGVVGVSTDATLHAVKVLDSGGGGYFSDIAAGIEHVADEGWDVGSLSLGGSSGSAALQDAVQYATNNGVFLVAAAGNSGPCSNCVGYPAVYPEVVAVSSTNDSDGLSYFSSTGPEIEVAAPGSSVYSTYMGGGYDTLSGTSMACPHVAGAAGQLMANGESNSQARNTLTSTAEDIGLGSNEQGSGLLDVQAALDGGGGTDPDPAVSTGSATNVGTSAATLNGSLDDLGDASSADVHFEYRETGASSWTATPTQTLSATGSFTDDVSGLASSTDHEFRAVANASDGDSATGSTATFTTDSDGGGGAPTIDSFTVTEAGSPNPHADITADWAVSDGDGDLSSVTVTLYDSAGSEIDSSTTGVGGSSASGSDSFKVKHASGQTFDVELTVSDSGGNSTSQTESVSA